MRATAESAPAPAETSAADLHLFDFAEPVTIGGRETRQIALFPAATVKVHKEYRLEGNGSYFGGVRQDTQRTSPTVRYRFENTVAAGLGRSLPGGTVRLYVPTGGGAILRAEDSLRHTPVGERVTLTAGEGRDQGLSGRPEVLRPAPVTVTVVEYIPGDWRMLSESQTHKKRAANQAVWNVTVPAGGKAELTYRVRIRF